MVTGKTGLKKVCFCRIMNRIRDKGKIAAKRQKKLTALVIAFSLAAALLAGCGAVPE